jgi:hypothetical protein
MANFSLDDLTAGITSVQNGLGGGEQLTQGSAADFKANGFLLPASFQADGNGLPYSKVQNNRDSQMKRNIITWFIPEFGVVKMYVNPSSIKYSNKKVISKERTKGGYTLQYWGEELTTISISGTTGSSGIEGINVLEEIYRAEQYAFDSSAITLAANNASTDLSANLANSFGNSISGIIGAGAGGLAEGILGLDSPNNNLAQQNIPSLAQLAFGVEMYYNGWVFRGFFDNMDVTESADNFLFQYNITFIATQRRGYRTNNFAFQRSPNGPSQDGSVTNNLSLSGNVKTG